MTAANSGCAFLMSGRPSHGNHPFGHHAGIGHSTSLTGIKLPARTMAGAARSDAATPRRKTRRSSIREHQRFDDANSRTLSGASREVMGRAISPGDLRDYASRVDQVAQKVLVNDANKFVWTHPEYVAIARLDQFRRDAHDARGTHDGGRGYPGRKPEEKLPSRDHA